MNCQTLGTAPYLLCEACRAPSRVLASTSFTTHGYPVSVFAAGAYEGVARRLIMRKAGSDTRGSVALAEMMCERWPAAPLPAEVFVPVPLHWRRYLRRGYNQAAVMAHELAKEWGGMVAFPVQRSRATIFQSSLSVTQRSTNVLGAFALRQGSSQLRGKHVVLVDDLMTTGATLQAIVGVLARCKPASIGAVVAARVSS